MSEWNKKHQSSDIIKCNARNTYIEVNALEIWIQINSIFKVALKSSQRRTPTGRSEIEVSCMTRKFHVQNNQRYYSAGEDNYISNIYSIDNGMYSLVS